MWRARIENRSDRLALWNYLDDEERQRAREFYREIHGERFASARGLLRRLVAAYVGQSPEQVRFTAGPLGKPELAAPPAALSFNLSHSEGLALMAFARQGRLGIDVEWVRHLPEAFAIARRNFAPAEVQWLESSPPEQQAEIFFRIWTRKEAVLKAVGAGLTVDLQSFDVVPVWGTGEVVPMSLALGQAPAAWRWFDLHPGSEFQGCMVYDGAVEGLRTLEAAEIA